MVFVIGRLVDSSNKLTGYRLLSYESGETKDASVKSILVAFKALDIKNFTLGKDDIHDIGGENLNYPIINSDNSEVVKNKIVILFKTTKGTYVVTDGTGSKRQVTFEQIRDCDKTKVANIKSFKEFKVNKCQKGKSKEKTNVSKDDTVGKISGKQWDIFEDTSLVKNLLGRVSSLVVPIINSVAIRNKDDNYDIDSISQSIWEQLDTPLNIQERILPKQPQSNIIHKEIDEISPSYQTNQIEETDTPQSEVKAEGESGDYEILITRDNGRVIATGIEPHEYCGAVKIPDGVTHIRELAFVSSKITSCELPESLVYMGESAFARSHLEEIRLPSKLKAIPHNCFYKSDLKTINLEYITSIGNQSFAKTKITEAIFEAELTQIGIEAFEGCSNLEVFKHPGTIRKIRSGAFSGCLNLREFDFTGVTEIEDQAFYSTALTNVVINGEVTYVKSSTFVSDNLETVEILDGCYKLADGCCISQVPITYTIPKSVSNIGVHIFKKVDTVRCYHGSIAESTAKIADCNIEYLDQVGDMSKVVLKASMIGMDIKGMIERMIEKAYNSDDVEYEYEIDQNCKLVDIGLTAEQLRFLGIASIEKPEGYKEKSKFKVVLEHYAKSCKLNGIGLSSSVLTLKDTLSIENKPIYDDGISRVYEFTYSDHKYESKKAKYIIAMTGDSVRYCCLNNRYTDVYCKTAYSKDLSRLLEVLVPGDTIGYDCTIAGKRYEQIASKSNIKSKNNELISMNIYQALFNCSIAIKLDRNHLALILPVNGKILKCASLGKAVWANENDESYKTKYCVIEDIQDLKGNTIIEYGVNSPSRDDKLFDEINSLGQAGLADRIKEYSTVGKAKISPYYTFRNYCKSKDISKLSQLDLKGLGYLLAFPTVEERSEDWLDKHVGKTIVDASKSSITLSDNTKIRQYKTVKRVAMKNKLLTGGDRTIYVYEVFSKFGQRLKTMSSIVTIDDLFDIGISMLNIDTNKADRIYKNTSNFDIVKLDDMIMVAAAFVNTHEKTDAKQKFNYMWLTVYKPNGLYYLSFVSKSNNIAIPLVQLGDFSVVLDYIDCADTSSASGYKILMSAGLYMLDYYRLSKSSFYNSGFRGSMTQKVHYPQHRSLLAARNLAINGVYDIKQYMETKVDPVICHMFGVNEYKEDLYSIQEYTAFSSDTTEVFSQPSQSAEPKAKRTRRAYLNSKPTKAMDIEIEDDYDVYIAEDEDEDEVNLEIDDTDIEIADTDIEIDEEDVNFFDEDMVGFVDGLESEFDHDDEADEADEEDDIDPTLDAMRLNELLNNQ